MIFGHPRHEVELGHRFGSQAVIDAGRDDLVLALLAHQRQHVQQRHRVGAARASDHHAIAGAEQLLVFDAALGERQQRGGAFGGARHRRLSLWRSVFRSVFLWGAAEHRDDLGVALLARHHDGTRAWVRES